ncbi:MAG: precorrin-6Y C5,15-methyltransferase (decarboxylating) subunit CbiT [Lachnospiraceae bacterium]|nr:precorrin-6Y C5,15-methyltransferase (decarboxylating) subunit CbiT [Lachnospiraceae bacterium]
MRITLVGTGCGTAATLTEEGRRAFQSADVVIGAGRVLEGIRDIFSEEQSERKVFLAAKPNQICYLLEDCYRQNNEINVAIALSGDSGFYSGARFLKQRIADRFLGKDESSVMTKSSPVDAENMRNQVLRGTHQAKEIKVEILPGISSVQMLAARLGIPWQDWNLASAHGIDCDPVYEIMKGRKTFFLTGGKYTADVICRELTEAGLGDLRVTVGENLSYFEKRGDISESDKKRPDGWKDRKNDDAFENALKDSVSESGKKGLGCEKDGRHDGAFESALKDSIIVSGKERQGGVLGSRENLGCERITVVTAAECSQLSFSNLSVLLVDTESHLPKRAEHEDDFRKEEFADGCSISEEGIQQEYISTLRQEEFADGCLAHEEGFRKTYISAPRYGIPDSEFIRGKVPMTKMEVRNIILGKMGVREGDVVWDIGAGTGSVSVELAMRARQVWSLERNEEAIGLLHANREKFGRWNMHVVQGDAPGDLEKLPTPDRVFVGGSGGKLKDILEEAWARNEGVRICVSAVLLETLWECTEAFEEQGICPEIVQVAVNRVEKTGGRHMMKAGNPVFIITGGKESGQNPGSDASHTSTKDVRELRKQKALAQPDSDASRASTKDVKELRKQKALDRPGSDASHTSTKGSV